MKTPVLALVLCLAAPNAAPSPTPNPAPIVTPPGHRQSAGDFAWLAGAWVSRSGDRTVEEHWTPFAGGLMLGVGRTITPGRPTDFEYLRIVEHSTGLIYIAQPGGGPATEFQLTKFSPTELIFENPKHDFPQRLAYRRTETGGLVVRVETLAGDKGFTLEFTRAK